MTGSESSALAVYLARVDRGSTLPAEARAAFLSLATQRKRFESYREIVRERDRPISCCVVETGLVSRYKTLRNGARQILSFHLPGDMIDLQSALVVIADHGIRTHVPTTVITITHDDILRVAAEHPSLGRALWFDTLVDAAVFREWTVNVGRRNARERTAHLLLEFEARLRVIGCVHDDSFELPISQADLADALGVTAVHLNRTMQALRRERMIRTVSQTVTIENRPAMEALAGFDATYLHPEGPRSLPGLPD